MSTLLESIRESIQKLSQKTDEMTRVGRLKIAIIATNRDIEKKMIALGGVVYELLKDTEKIDKREHAKIDVLTGEIKELELKLDSLKKEIERIKTEDGVDLD